MARLTDRRERLIEAYLDKDIEPREFKEMQARISAQLEELEMKMRSARLKIEQVRATAEAALRLASSCASVYRETTATRRRAMNSMFFKKVYVKGGRVSKVENTELFDLILSRPSTGASGSNKEALVELNGAFSNPFVTDKSLLIRLVELRRMLLQRAAERPLEPPPAPPWAAPVLETVTLVLELAGRPMSACEIHAAATELLARLFGGDR